VGVSVISGAADGVGVRVSVGVAVSVGIAKAVWVRSAAKVPTAWVWMVSTLKVGVAWLLLDPQLLKKILAIRKNPSRAVDSVKFFTNRSLIWQFITISLLMSRKKLYLSARREKRACMCLF